MYHFRVFCRVQRRSGPIAPGQVDFVVRLVESAIPKKMAPRAVFWVDLHIGLKLKVVVWEFDGK